ncbi:hypothetical protein ACFQQB_58135 [Nonomuraea rubra]
MMLSGNPPPHVNLRIKATLLILLFVLLFVVTLLVLGYDLWTAIVAAGAVGLVSAEITARLLGG